MTHRYLPQHLTPAQAVDRIQNGQTLGLGGNMLYRRPVALVRALLNRAQPPRHLTLLSFTAGYTADLLVGAGCVERTRTCYFGLEAFGFAPMFTQAANQGQIEVMEETEMSLALGIRATLAGVGFLPSMGWLGTDLPQLRPDVKTVRDPYSGQELIAFPAITCDVALIHALAVDRYGNAQLSPNVGIDPELAAVSEHVIVSAEAVVDRIDGPVHIPGPLVDVVVPAPHGAWPTSCYPRYALGGGELLRYVEACAQGEFDAYLARLNVTPAQDDPDSA